MNDEEKFTLISELSAEKEAHTQTLIHLQTLEQVNQSLTALNEGYQQSMTDCQVLLEAKDLELAQDKAKIAQLEEQLKQQGNADVLQQQVADAQAALDQQLRKWNEERHQLEEDYKVLESEKLSSDRALRDAQNQLEDAKHNIELMNTTIQTLQTALEKAQEEASNHVGNSASDELVKALEQEKKNLLQKLEEQQAAYDEEIQLLKTRLTKAERNLIQSEESAAEAIEKASKLEKQVLSQSHEIKRLNAHVEQNGNGHNEDYDKQLASKDIEIQKLQQEEEALRKELENEKKKYKLLLEENEKSNEAIAAIQDSSDQAQTKINKIQREKSELQAQLKKSQQEKEELASQLKSLKEKENQPENQQDNQPQAKNLQEIEELKTQINELQQENEEIQAAFNKAIKTVQQEKAKSTKLEELYTAEVKKSQELSESIAALKTTPPTPVKNADTEALKKRLREEMMSHSTTLEQLDEIQKKYQESNNIIKNLTADVKKLQASTAPLKREIDSLKAANAQLTKKLNEEREAWRLEQQRQEQLSKAKDEQIVSKALEDSKKQHEEAMKEAQEELNRRKKAIQLEREATESARQQLHDTIQLLEKERIVITELKAHLSEAGVVADKLRRENESIAKELEEARRARTEEEKKELNETVQELKQTQQKYHELEAKYEVIVKEKADMTSSIHKLELALEESLRLHKEEITDLKNQIAQLQNQNSSSQELALVAKEYKEKVQELNAELNRLQEENNQLNSDVATLNEAYRKLDRDAQAQLDKAEAETKKFQATIQELQKSVAALESSKIKDISAEVAELKRELLAEKEAHEITKEQREKDKIDMEVQMIENLQSQIQKLREVYESQALIERDFHSIHSQIEDAQASMLRSNEYYFPSQKIKDSVSSLQRELMAEREALRKTQVELENERRNYRSTKQIANELELHVLELSRAHSKTASDLDETQKQIYDLKKELERERSKHAAHSPYYPPSSSTSSYEAHVPRTNARTQYRAESTSPTSITPPLSPRRENGHHIPHIPVPRSHIDTHPERTKYAPPSYAAHSYPIPFSYKPTH